MIAVMMLAVVPRSPPLRIISPKMKSLHPIRRLKIHLKLAQVTSNPILRSQVVKGERLSFAMLVVKRVTTSGNVNGTSTITMSHLVSLLLCE